MMTSHGFSLKRCMLDAIFSADCVIIFGPLRAWCWTVTALTSPAAAGLDGRHRHARAFSVERLFRYRRGRPFPVTLRSDSAGVYVRPRNTKPHALDYSLVITLRFAFRLSHEICADRRHSRADLRASRLGLNIVVGLAVCWIWDMSRSTQLVRTVWAGIPVSRLRLLEHAAAGGNYGRRRRRPARFPVLTAHAR